MDLSSLIARLTLPPSTDSGRPAVPAPVPVDWDAVESWLGLGLPADYRALVSALGPLDVGEHLWLHTPCVREGGYDYGDWLWETHRECRISSRRAMRREPPPFHPEPGGLLAWGETRGSARLLWDTGASGDPDRWPVVVFDAEAARRGSDPWHDCGTTLTQTLAVLLTTGIRMPGGRALGPLPPTARRTAFLVGARPWRPPAPAPEPVPERAPGERYAAPRPPGPEDRGH
ncbi:hypothetical protein [Streptomyces radiopugnans]|uniref:SMI1-KNR4 cell-wall n=1 Tax=Streptomyces radiopugnans TaxID=403935 RepID=A0A1H8Z1F5_9ACTN|nr:hypothetical protein [Streptomyces radiopugnans]SEP58152.1 hypothetical protein SAMN05216481_101237 [Streptomyces radiopugnans]